jgi:hypothetical protein
MQLHGQTYTKAIIDQIAQTVKQDPAISRRALSKKLCREQGWYSTSGNLQETNCRKALLELENRGLLKLPPAKHVANFEQKRIALKAEPEPILNLSLDQLGTIKLNLVGSHYSKDAKTCRALFEKYHYLGPGRLCGSQLRYIVESEHLGPIGALAFSSASWALKERDSYIGWSKAAQAANLNKVIKNARFILMPHLKVFNLASTVLAMALKQLPRDWSKRYSTEVVLVESFVDTTRFSGGCYKAANWLPVGLTSGRRGSLKQIYLYPLQKNWRKELCREPEQKLGSRKVLKEVTNWAEQEFSTVRLYDSRLKKRLNQIAQDFYDYSTGSIPARCGSRAKTVATYRFLSNPEVTMDVILTAHTEATIERLKEETLVLAPQDTTILDYSLHPATEGLGPTNTEKDKSQGLILHDTIAFSEQGTPLGVIDAQCWARDPEDKGKSARRKELPTEQKESAKWLRSFQKLTLLNELCPETTFVSIGDREADIYDLFSLATVPHSPELLVRIGAGRQRKVEADCIFKKMSQKEAAGHLQVTVPRRGSQKERKAKLTVRYAQVTLDPPLGKPEASPVELNCVYLLEVNPPANTKPLMWLLLTTVPVASFADAQKITTWYTRRWGIEVYHRILKSGLKVETHQLKTAERLENCLAVDMVVAWRIFNLTMLGREKPDLPCSVYFSEDEWQALCILSKDSVRLPKALPTIKEAVFMLARVGGFQGRKSDGFPGAEVLWRGLLLLEGATWMFSKIKNEGLPPPGTLFP